MVHIDEMMVGDLIINKRNNRPGIISEIKNNSAIIREFSSHIEDDIEDFLILPMKITPELLEDNGFVKFGCADIYGWHGEDNSGETIEINFTREECVARGKNSRFEFRRMLSVNELQHIIKDCEIKFDFKFWGVSTSGNKWNIVDEKKINYYRYL